MLGLDRWWPGLALCAVWLAVMVVLLVRFPGDWYEDVLRTAELASPPLPPRKRAIWTPPPARSGWGRPAWARAGGPRPSTISRNGGHAGGWLLLSPSSLAFAGVVIVLAVLWRSAGLLTLFGLSVYLQIFSTGQNRLSRELGKPFLYLVPEPAFAKLLQCLRALLPSAGMEAVVTFVPVCLLLGLGPGSILACVFSRLTYALLFQSGDLLVERFWSRSKQDAAHGAVPADPPAADAAGRDRGYAALWLFPAWPAALSAADAPPGRQSCLWHCFCSILCETCWRIRNTPDEPPNKRR